MHDKQKNNSEKHLKVLYWKNVGIVQMLVEKIMQQTVLGEAY